MQELRPGSRCLLISRHVRCRPPRHSTKMQFWLSPQLRLVFCAKKKATDVLFFCAEYISLCYGMDVSLSNTERAGAPAITSIPQWVTYDCPTRHGAHALHAVITRG